VGEKNARRSGIGEGIGRWESGGCGEERSDGMMMLRERGGNWQGRLGDT
jgi:hypothetical protein